MRSLVITGCKDGTNKSAAVEPSHRFNRCSERRHIAGDDANLCCSAGICSGEINTVENDAVGETARLALL
jgi:hypothetical protein